MAFFHCCLTVGTIQLFISSFMVRQSKVHFKGNFLWSHPTGFDPPPRRQKNLEQNLPTYLPTYVPTMNILAEKCLSMLINFWY